MITYPACTCSARVLLPFGIPVRHKTDLIHRNLANRQCEICVSLGQSYPVGFLYVRHLGLLHGFAELKPDRSGRLSRAGAPSTDLMATFSFYFASPDCSCLIFPRGTESRFLQAGCPTRTDPSAACTSSRLQNFPFPTSQCPNVKRFFSLEIDCSQTSSPPPAMSSTATPTMPWYLCCEPLSTKTHGSKTDVSKPSLLAAARKQFLHSLVPSASPSTVSSSCTQTLRDSPGTPSGGILTKSGCSLLIGFQC